VDNAEPEESVTVDFIKKLWYNIIGGAKLRPARDVRSLFDFIKKIWYNKMGTFFLYIKCFRLKYESYGAPRLREN
jgi:hypothetical protein